MLQPSQATDRSQQEKGASEDKAIARLRQWCLFKRGLFICTSTFGSRRRADPPTRPFPSSVLAAPTWGLAVLELGMEGLASSSFNLGLVAP